MVFRRNTKRHLMKDAHNFLSFTELKERFDVKTNFLAYHGLVSCIKLLRNAIENQNEKNKIFSTFVENFIKAPKSNRLAYKKLVSAKQSSPRKSQEKWSADCNLQFSKTIDWDMAYKLPFYSTKATKLTIFQFKLLHRRLATNDFLDKIGIRENDICTFCRTEKESLLQLFWSCSETFSFWQGFMKWLAENQIKLKSEILTPDLIIILRSDILSDTKQYFYFLLRCLGPVPPCQGWPFGPAKILANLTNKDRISNYSNHIAKHRPTDWRQLWHLYQDFLPDGKYWRLSNMQIFKSVNAGWNNGYTSFRENCWDISGTFVTCKFAIRTETFIHSYSGWISSECAYLVLSLSFHSLKITDIELVVNDTLCHEGHTGGKNAICPGCLLHRLFQREAFLRSYLSTTFSPLYYKNMF